MAEREVEIYHSPHIETLRGMQEAHGFLSAVLNPEENEKELFCMLQDEVTELQDALATGDREIIANELADVILFSTQVASYYGIDVSDAVSRKIDRNFHKYNPAEIKRLEEEEGLSAREARLKLKQEWNKSKDHDFFKGV
jgi:NTP pyrophosphatase (non-canonical NTP hydrolase)